MGKRRGGLALNVSLDHFSSVMRKKINTSVGMLVDLILKECRNYFMIAFLDEIWRRNVEVWLCCKEFQRFFFFSF